MSALKFVSLLSDPSTHEGEEYKSEGIYLCWICQMDSEFQAGQSHFGFLRILLNMTSCMLGSLFLFFFLSVAFFMFTWFPF